MSQHPTAPPPPPSPPRSTPAPPPPPPAAAATRSGDDGPARTIADAGVPAATWVAAVGVALVLAAAGALVVGSWNHIRPEIKLAGLVVADAVLAAVATASRRRLPVVSRSLAHLAAMMTVPAGVAVLAAAHQTWPAATFAGGACGVVACVLQSRRWRAPLLVPAADVAAVVGLAGAAAGIHAPLGVLVAVAALGLALVGRHASASAARLAGVAAAVPLLAVLGAFGVGSGTASRLGARGDVLAWAGPVAGVLAAAALAIVASRRRLVPAAAAALVAAASGTVTGLAVVRPGLSVWWGVAGAVLLAVVVAASFVAADDGANVDGASVDGASVDGAGGGAWAVVLRPVVGAVAGVTVAAGVPALSVLAGELLSPRRDGAGAWAWCVWAALAVASSWRPDRTGADVVDARAVRAAAVATLLAAVALAGGNPLAVVLAAAVVVGVAPWCRLGPVEQAGTGAVALLGAVATRWWPASSTTTIVAVGAAAFAWFVLAWRLRVVAPARRVPASVMGAAVAGSGVAAAWPWGGWAVSVGSAVAVGVLASARSRHGAAALLPATALAVVVAAGSSWTAIALGFLLAAIALTGAAMTTPRLTVVDTVAVSAGLVAAFATLHRGQAELGLVSLAGMVVGVQGVLYGRLRRNADLTVAGLVLAAASLVSLPATSGLVGYLVGVARPHGITPTDIAVAALVPALVVGGVVVRRAYPAMSSWPAYGPGLALAGLHLLTTQAATHQPGRAVVAVAVGVVAVGVGGWRRLGAPLLGGTGLVAAAVVLASGRQLASLPMWVWLAAGGAALLTVAGLIELRTPAGAGDDDSGERLVCQVWHRLG